MKLVSRDVFEALCMLQPYDIDAPKRIFGGDRDGSYVLADIFVDPDVLSIGIDHNDSFDWDMAELGCRVFMFDHTIDAPPRSHGKFFFYRKGVRGSRPEDADRNLISIEDMDALCHFRNGSILKMDVEGTEWDVFSSLSDAVFSLFDQIVVEIHWLANLGDPKFRWKVCESLRRINAHFTLFHVHGNNNGDLDLVDGFVVANVMELSYVRTSLVQRSLSKTFYPSSPNRGNSHLYHDLPLLFFPFLPSNLGIGGAESVVSRICQDFDSSGDAT